MVYQPLMHALPCRKHQRGARGLLIAMNARTGRELWSFRAGAIESSPLQVGGVLLLRYWDRYVYAVDARTRKLRWRYRTDDRVVAAPAYAHGTIYVPSNGGRLYALNASARASLRWRSSSFSRFGRREYFYATPTVAYGRVFVGNADGYVYSFGATSGRLLWARRAGTYVYSAAAVWHPAPCTWGRGTATSSPSTRRPATRAGATTRPARSPARRPSWPGCSTSRSLRHVRSWRPQRHVERGPPPDDRARRAHRPAAVWRFPDGKYSPIVADQERVYLVGRTRVYALAERPKRKLAQAKP